MDCYRNHFKKDVNLIAINFKPTNETVAMRPSPKEASALLNVFKSFGLIPDCKVFLFGSRVDSAKKGVDIDLLLLCPESRYQQILEKDILSNLNLNFRWASNEWI